MSTPLHEYPPFPGFRDEGLAFLRDLRGNNNREWFEAHRSTYEDEVRTPLKCLVADVARRLWESDLPLTGHPNTSCFRIYRDLRFASGKPPYKTNVGAVFDRSGKKRSDGVVYVHVEPGASFVAAGFYRPSVAYLRPIRRAMVEDPERFFEMRATMEARGLPVTSLDETLKGMPQGFSAFRDEDVAPYLKWKHFVVERAYPDAALQRPDFAEEVVRMAKASRPLLEYVWRLEATEAA